MTDSTEEKDPRPALFSRRDVLVAGIAAAAIVASIAVVLATPVRIDGQWHEVGFSTLGHLADAGALASRPGDLLSAAAGHRVIRKGGGGPVVFRIAGNEVSSSTRPWPWQVVTTQGGANRIESVKTLERTVEPPVRTIGTGAIEDIVSQGHPGLDEVEVGAASGDVVSTRTVSMASPLIVWRDDPLPAGKKVVALTFDDGPWPRQTQAILSILTSEGVHATFFEVGQAVDAHPDLSRMVLADGMELGNHTQTHLLLGHLPYATVFKEIAYAQGSIKKATGVTPHWFRPPGGSVSPTVYRVAAKLGVRPVLWSVDPNDWKRPPASVIVTRVLSQVHPGAVILMHDGGGIRANTIAALPVIINALKKQGYTFLTLDQFPGAHGSGRLKVK